MARKLIIITIMTTTLYAVASHHAIAIPLFSLKNISRIKNVVTTQHYTGLG
jgi:hypothetical protein